MIPVDSAGEKAAQASSEPLHAFDRFVDEIDRWMGSFPEWQPARRIAGEWSGVGPRLAAVRGELARVLVVGVLGGTGTGKSTLVNALAGSDVTPAGDVARPTTKRPVVVAGPQVDCEWLPLERWGARLVRSDSEAVAEIVLVDCPDPDTQGFDGAAEGETTDASGGEANRNRDLLEDVLPACDVLLVVSTAQKYRSWAVTREIARFAPGRPVLFVQTHASRDVDIREDWRRDLEAEGFDVPSIHLVDGVEAIRRAAEGLPPDEGFAAVLASIRTELAGRAARRVRRTGASDLAQWFFRHSSSTLAGFRGPVDEFRLGLDRERRRLGSAIAVSAARSFRGSRQSLHRRVVAEIVDSWQGGPFAAFLNAVAKVGSLWPRTPASSIDAFVLPESEIEQSRSILVGLAARAAIVEPIVGRARLPEDRAASVAMEVRSRTERWVADGVDSLVASRRGRPSWNLLRIVCEAAFGGLLVAVLWRAGWSFFHDRLWMGIPSDTGGFLWESLFWVAVCGLALRWLVVAAVQRGLDREAAGVASRLSDSTCVDPALADFMDAARRAVAFIADADRLAREAASITTLAGPAVSLGRLVHAPASTIDGSVSLGRLVHAPASTEAGG